MKGTNRKEMRKLLNKYIALMKVAFDNGLNMDIHTRKNKENGRPWFVGQAHAEECSFTDEDMEGILYILFSAYEWRSVADNEEQLKRVAEFVEKHKK